MHTASRKLLSKFVGPLEVLASPAHCSNPNIVYLKVPRTLKIHQPINVKDIKRYHTRTAYLGGPPKEMPEPLIVDGEDLHEVEAVLAERVSRNKRQVLDKWTGGQASICFRPRWSRLRTFRKRASMSSAVFKRPRRGGSLMATTHALRNSTTRFQDQGIKT